MSDKGFYAGDIYTGCCIIVCIMYKAGYNISYIIWGWGGVVYSISSRLQAVCYSTDSTVVTEYMWATTAKPVAVEEREVLLRTVARQSGRPNRIEKN